MDYNKWIVSFMDGWKNRDIDAVMKTISNDCKYYESAFKEPCKDVNEIKFLWEVVPLNQKDINYSYEIILENDKYCIVNFLIERTLIPSLIIQKIDGIFLISLNQDGLCKYFKQWRSIKEE